MKEKYGEAIGANFSFAAFYIVGYLIIALGAIFLFTIEPMIALPATLIAVFLLNIIVSAARMVFIAATYNHINGLPSGNYNTDTLDGIFMPK